MKNKLPLLTPLLGLTLFSLLLATSPALHAEDSQSDKVADKAKPRAFKAQASDGVTAKAKTKKKKAKVKKPRKPAAAE